MHLHREGFAVHVTPPPGVIGVRAQCIRPPDRRMAYMDADDNDLVPDTIEPAPWTRELEVESSLHRTGREATIHLHRLARAASCRHRPAPQETAMDPDGSVASAGAFQLCTHRSRRHHSRRELSAPGGLSGIGARYDEAVSGQRGSDLIVVYINRVRARAPPPVPSARRHRP